MKVRQNCVAEKVAARAQERRQEVQKRIQKVKGELEEVQARLEAKKASSGEIEMDKENNMDIEMEVGKEELSDSKRSLLLHAELKSLESVEGMEEEEEVIEPSATEILEKKWQIVKASC